DQQAPTRVDVKSSRVYLPGFDVLDRCRFAGGLVDRIYDDAVFTPLEDLLALKLRRGVGTVCPVDKTAVRMDMDRACRLTRPDVVRLTTCPRTVSDLSVDPFTPHPKYLHLVLRL